jgi:serine/threonine protein kinase
MPFRRKPAAPTPPQGSLGKGLERGSFLAEYEVLEKLGEGGMGVVYKARHRWLKRVVALKLLTSNHATDERAVARFQREMEAVGQLSHPNIVQAYHAQLIENTFVLVMEYLEGVTLGKLVRHGERLSTADACEAIRQAALGLDYASQQGLVHRDIKPSNLQLTPGGQVKVLDFGLALVPSDRSLTASGQAVGTADYMAPEQVLNSRDVDPRADLYSLGCTLTMLLAGAPPFGDPEYTSEFEKMTAHAYRPAPALATLRPDLPPELAALVDRLLAKDPNRRPANGGEVAAVLEPFAVGSDLAGLVARVAKRMQARIQVPDNSSGGSSQAATILRASGPEESAGRSPRSPWRIVVWGVALLLVATGVSWYVIDLSHPEPDEPRFEGPGEGNLEEDDLPDEPDFSVEAAPEEKEGAKSSEQPPADAVRFRGAHRIFLRPNNEGRATAVIHPASDVDLHYLRPRASGEVQITVTPTASLAVRVELYGNAREVDPGTRPQLLCDACSAQAGSPASLHFQARRGLTRYLLVRSADGKSEGDYEIAIDSAANAALSAEK